MGKYEVPGKMLAKDDAVRLVLNNYERSRNDLVDPKRDQWKEGYDAYRSAMEIPDDTLVSQLALPLIYTTVEDFLPRLADTPKIEVWGRGPEDQSRSAKHRAKIKYDWQNLNVMLKMVMLAKTAEIYGTGWVKLTYRKSVQRRLVREITTEEISVLGEPAGSRKNSSFSWKAIPVWDDPWMEVCEIDAIYPDPDGKNFDITDPFQCHWGIHETEATLSDLKGARLDGEPLYENLDELEELLKRGNPLQPQGNTQTLKEYATEGFDERTHVTADPNKRQVTLLERWSHDKVITVVREYPQLPPIRNQGNALGYIPILGFTPVPDLHSIYGISVPETLYSMQIELQTLHAARMDNLMQQVHSMYTITKNSGINPNDLQFSPSGVVWVRDHGHIQPMRRDTLDFSVYRESQEIDRWAQKAGSTDTFAGLSAGGGTATEANVLAEASGSKAGLMLKLLGWQVLTPMGRQLMRLNELYMTDERFLRVAGDEFAGEEFERVTPEELLMGSGMDLDVTIDLASHEPVTAQAKLQRAERFLGVLAQVGMGLDHPVMQATLLDYVRGTGLSANPEALLFGDQAKASVQRQAEVEAGAQQPTSPAAGVEGQGQQIAAELGAQLGGPSPN